MLIVSAVALSALGGCSSQSPGAVRTLGPVAFDQALETARATLADYSFTIDTEDPVTGKFVTDPLWSEESSGRLLGGKATTRKIATLQLLASDNNVVIAKLSIAVERQSQAIRDAVIPEEQGGYSGVPNQSPSDSGAATTIEQNQAWRRVGYDHSMEAEILQDLHERLQGSASKTRPAATEPSAAR